MLLLSENVKVLDLTRKEKQNKLKLLRSMGRYRSSIHEIVKRERNSCKFAVAAHTAKVRATLDNKCLVKMESH